MVMVTSPKSIAGAPIVDVAEVLISRRQIARRVRTLADEINRRYGRQELTVLGVLMGSVVFMADLVRGLQMPLRVEAVGMSSYRGACCEAGSLEISMPLDASLRGRHVLIVDDILDTGATLEALRTMVRSHEPASVAACVLLRKDLPSPRPRPEMEFIGFDVPHRFVVGYGLDYDGRYRNLPDVCVLKTLSPAPEARGVGDKRPPTFPSPGRASV